MSSFSKLIIYNMMNGIWRQIDNLVTPSGFRWGYA